MSFVVSTDWKYMMVATGARDGLAEFAFHTTLAIGDMMYHQLAPYSQLYGHGLVAHHFCFCYLFVLFFLVLCTQSCNVSGLSIHYCHFYFL
jgi:hypothetical protein